MKIRFIKNEPDGKYLITNYKIVKGKTVFKPIGCWKWLIDPATNNDKVA